MADRVQAGDVAEDGLVHDLRGEAASLFMQLVYWDGTDLKRVHEPISQQVEYLFSLLVLILVLRIVLMLVLRIAYGVCWKKQREYRERTMLYQVIKPPQNVGDGKVDQRVMAVSGETGINKFDAEIKYFGVIKLVFNVLKKKTRAYLRKMRQQVSARDGQCGVVKVTFFFSHTRSNSCQEKRKKNNHLYSSNSSCKLIKGWS